LSNYSKQSIIILKEAIIGKYGKFKKRTLKTNPGASIQHLSGMQHARRSGKNDSRTARTKTLGLSRYQEENQSCRPGSLDQSKQARTQTTRYRRRTIPTSVQRTNRDQRRVGCRRTRIILVKKKDELGLKGSLIGHFTQEVKRAVVTIINTAVSQGLTQKYACTLFGINPRKFRRWANPSAPRQRVAWNKIRPPERQAIIDATYLPGLLGKPLSHVFVHGHNTDEFFASLSTVYRVLKSVHLVKPDQRQKARQTGYITAHELMEQGFSLLCYDGTQFTTVSGLIVWAIPVMILPTRYVLCIGHTINSISGPDLMTVVKQAYALIPDLVVNTLIAHSDRGSAMKSSYTRQTIKELLGAPVHFGRPHTPDDEGWIEAFIKTLKYHREAPAQFNQVDDIVQWINRFPDIYNNEPHSSLKYVTPTEALSGKMEVILKQRKQNLALARLLRYTAWKAAQSSGSQAATQSALLAEQVEVNP
jgi:transposase InsO family protein